MNCPTAHTTRSLSLTQAGGSSFNDVVDCTVLMADLKEYAAFNAVYAKYFPDNSAPVSVYAIIKTVQLYDCVALNTDIYSEIDLRWYNALSYVFVHTALPSQTNMLRHRRVQHTKWRSCPWTHVPK